MSLDFLILEKNDSRIWVNGINILKLENNEKLASISKAEAAAYVHVTFREAWYF